MSIALITHLLKDSNCSYYSIATQNKFIPFHQSIKLKSMQFSNIKAFCTQLKEGSE